jgi:hydrogenase maturation protease
MIETTTPTILVLGYGNPGRRDDGLGPALAEQLDAGELDGLRISVGYQLNIEDAATLSAHPAVLFVDASKEGPAPFSLHRVYPDRTITFTSHAVGPASLLALSAEHFGHRPRACLLAIRGYDFSLGDGLSENAAHNLSVALRQVTSFLLAWRIEVMDTSPLRKKTVLTIDDDGDIRAALRVVLQAEGFRVGEASSGEEGLAVARNIDPDAIIVDLMMEKVDSGRQVAASLRGSGYSKPIYLLSSAGDTVRWNVNAEALGLTGIFQKPVEPRTLVQTLKQQLAQD